MNKKAPRGTDFKTVLAPAELKADTNERIIEGYAATFGNTDLVSDVIERGAFTKTISEQGNKDNRIKVFLWHREPIGVPILMEEQEKALFTRSRITNTPEGDKALAWVRDGIAAHMSIGFDVIKSETRKSSEGKEIRHIKEVKLWEYGPVVWPANPQARITAVKAMSTDIIRSTFGVLPMLADYMKAQEGDLTDTEVALLEVIRKELSSVNEDLSAIITAHLSGIREPQPRASTPEPSDGESKESAEPVESATHGISEDDLEALHSSIQQLRKLLT